MVSSLFLCDLGKHFGTDLFGIAKRKCVFVGKLGIEQLFMRGPGFLARILTPADRESTCRPLWMAIYSRNDAYSGSQLRFLLLDLIGNNSIGQRLHLSQGFVAR
jgi:hypothetical protein